MSQSWKEILEQIQQLQLLRPPEEKQVVAQFKSTLRSPAKCLVKLVNDGLLTKYQARHLLDGKGARLRLGNYVILGPLGKGAMGKVLKGRHVQMSRIVAIKTIHKENSSREMLTKRFSNEILFVSKLSHPNIVQAYDAGEADGVPYLVNEYVEGIDLQRLVSKSGPLDIQAALRYMTQAASALAYAHANHIIHRDVKPANLMVGADRNVKLLDLGLAKLFREDDDNEDSDMSLTSEHSIVGSCAFMAPELAKSTKAYGPSTDVYGLGCTFYYILNGKVPYYGKTYMETFIAHAQSKIPKLCESDKFLATDLNSLFERMVAKNPQQRIQHMAEVAAEFKKLSEMYKEHDSTPHGYTNVEVAVASEADGTSDSDWMDEAETPWYKEKKTLVSGAIILVGCIVGGAVWFSSREAEFKPNNNAKTLTFGAADINNNPTSQNLNSTAMPGLNNPNQQTAPPPKRINDSTKTFKVAD